MKHVFFGLIIFVAALAAFGRVETSPTPRPAVDWSKVPNADAQVEQMIAHRNALTQVVLDQTLPAANEDVKASLYKAQSLQKDIDAQAVQAAQVPILQAELDKAHKAIWRDILIAGGVCFVLGLFGPKLLGLASMVGV